MNDYIASVTGFPHPEGHYTGYVEYDDGRTWYTVTDEQGREFQTRDEPQTVICLSGVAHEEKRIVDASNTVIYAVSDYPQYYAKYMAIQQQEN